MFRKWISIVAILARTWRKTSGFGGKRQIGIAWRCGMTMVIVERTRRWTFLCRGAKVSNGTKKQVCEGFVQEYYGRCRGVGRARWVFYRHWRIWLWPWRGGVKFRLRCGVGWVGVTTRILFVNSAKLSVSRSSFVVTWSSWPELQVILVEAKTSCWEALKE